MRREGGKEEAKQRHRAEGTQSWGSTELREHRPEGAQTWGSTELREHRAEGAQSWGGHRAEGAQTWGSTDLREHRAEGGSELREHRAEATLSRLASCVAKHATGRAQLPVVGPGKFKKRATIIMVLSLTVFPICTKKASLVQWRTQEEDWGPVWG
jgi:hypothetical protein